MEIGENNLIRKLARFGRTREDIVRGIGDDGAVLDLPRGQYVLSQDALVERVHFDLSYQDLFDLGRKAVYVNVSDILAMGALPQFFLVTLGIPQRLRSADIERLYRGVARAAEEFEAVLVGGDITASPDSLFIDVTMMGRLVKERYVGRNGARPGQLIGVTGVLGESAYGLELLRKGEKPRQSTRFIRRYLAPRPPYDTWKALMQTDLPAAMMDVSDGLLMDLERMMAESGTKAVVHVERVPAVSDDEAAERLALGGGEDYQLLFTFDAGRLAELEGLPAHEPVSVIGEVVAGKGVEVREHGRKKTVRKRGYEHFGGAS